MKIGLIGRAGSGKDSFADYLVSKYHYEKHAFAEGLYKICREYYRMTTKDRALLQDVGKKMREIDELVFVNKLLHECDDRDHIVVSDVRHVNEYHALTAKKFVMVRIVADLPIRIARIEKRDGFQLSNEDIQRMEENPIETQLDNFPAIEIQNNKSLDAFYHAIDRFLLEQKDPI